MKFKVGDQVRIIDGPRIATSTKTLGMFVDRGPEYVGKVGTVIEVLTSDIYFDILVHVDDFPTPFKYREYQLESAYITEADLIKEYSIS